jgi:hypothetical protein
MGPPGLTSAATAAAPAGDFWHYRGQLPVEPLNEVVGLLAGWQQPTLMLPGNHDQASQGWRADRGTGRLLLHGQALLLLGLRVVMQETGAHCPTAPLPHCCLQASLGGEVHALTPLAAANPLIHAFDGPAMFLNALWMPYRRNRAMLEAALAAATAEAAAAAASGSGLSGSGGGARLQAVFAHTDIVSGSLGLGLCCCLHRVMPLGLPTPRLLRCPLYYT